MADEPEPVGVFSFVLDYVSICEYIHHMVKCYQCGHKFVAGEEYILKGTSGGSRSYSTHYSKFCLTCVMKALMNDLNFIEGMIDRRHKASKIAKENQAKSGRRREQCHTRR